METLGDKQIRVLLADDHEDMRGVIRTLINRQPDMQVVGEATDGWEAIFTAKDLCPQVLLMDMSMPHLGGVEATEIITRELPEISVVGFSVHNAPIYSEQMLAAGATGYVCKDSADRDLVKAIRMAAAHEVFVSPQALAENLNKQSEVCHVEE